jgi:PAS domain S-box-containing protein
MKNYLLAISAIFMIVTSVGLYNYMQINNENEKLLNLKSKFVEFQLLGSEQRALLQNLPTVTNYDHISNAMNQKERELGELEILSYEIGLKSIDIQMKKIYAQAMIKHELVEDYKSYHAGIKNSIAFMMQAYKAKVKDIQKTSFINDALAEDIQKMLMRYYTQSNDPFRTKNIPLSENEIEREKKSFEVTKNFILDNKMYEIMLYANILKAQEYYEKIVEVKRSLDEIKIVDHAQDMINILSREIEKNDQIKSYMLIFVLFCSISFLVISLLAFYREHEEKVKNQKLSIELKQFVDALNASAIVSKTDKYGVITFVNDTFCNISGYSREELIGSSQNIVRHPDIPKDIFEYVWNTIKNKKIFKGIIKNRKKDGSSYYVDVTIIPLLDIYGDVVEFLAVRYDVSDIVKARDLAIEVERAKSEFLSNMSHELRTPLNSIIGFSQILLKREKVESSKKYLQNVLDSSEHLMMLISDILDSAKIKSGKFKIDSHEFNLLESIEKSVNNLEPIALKREIKIVKKFDNSLNINVVSDSLRITQIINNLLSNAIKFSHVFSEVIIGVKYIEGMLYIKVKDHGIGMSDETQSKIFKSFIQADSSISKTYGGTGLGLSIVFDLVNIMGGKIDVESHLNKGSSFTVNIPLKNV